MAGTYTPVCLIPLRGAWGWSVFGVIWGIAVCGIALKILWMSAPRWVSLTVYLVMGWLVVIALVPITRTVPQGGIAWMAAGGALYSIGAVIYGFKRPNPIPDYLGFHEIWHLFVMGGSFCHFWMMKAYVLPMS